MGFYGKIYEQMGDVLNRLHFENAPAGTDNFADNPNGQFDLISESFKDEIQLVTGNSWIVFVDNSDNNGNLKCKIYHSKPRDAEDLVITEIISGVNYQDALGSEALTEDQKDNLRALREAGKLIYFGDKIKVAKIDEAGHVNNTSIQEYTIGEIPQLSAILEAANDIEELQDKVGIANYNHQENLNTRTLVLETGFATVEKQANDAEVKANESAASAEAAQQSAENANRRAEAAANSAKLSSDNLIDYQEETEDRFDVVDTKYTSLIGAVGVSDSVPVANRLGYSSIFLWALYADNELDILNGIIGDEDDAIRNGTADTLVEQIHSNDNDIAQLQEDLNQEVTDRATAINDLKDYVDDEITKVEQNASTNLNNKVSELNDADDALGDRITTETNERIAANTALNGRIDTEISARGTADQAINNRIDSIDSQIAGEGGINSRINGIDSRLTTAEASINEHALKITGDDTVAGSVASKIKAAVEAEANLRIAKDNELANLIAGLTTLVEEQQSVITGLQSRIEALEGYHTPENGEEQPTE